MKLVRIFFKAVTMELSRRMAYKADFIIRCFILVINSIISPIFALILYTTTPGIPGWKFEEFILFQGTLIFVFGFTHAFFWQLLSFTIYEVRKGSFDRFLLLPYKPLSYLTASSIETDGFSEMFTGIIIIWWAFKKLGLSIFSANFILYIYLVFLALVFHYSLNIITASFSLIFIRSWALMDILSSLVIFAKYPASIYHIGMVFFFTFIFPIAISAHYPVQALLSAVSYKLILFLTLSVSLFFYLSISLWNFGLKKYKSAGG